MCFLSEAIFFPPYHRYCHSIHSLKSSSDDIHCLAWSHPWSGQHKWVTEFPISCSIFPHQTKFTSEFFALKFTFSVVVVKVSLVRHYTLLYTPPRRFYLWYVAMLSVYSRLSCSLGCGGVVLLKKVMIVVRRRRERSL